VPAFLSDAASVPLAADRPLLIVDADEVILLFVDGFDKFLAAHDCYFEFASYALFGNVRRRSDGTALPDSDVTQLLDVFRDAFDSLAAVEGAREAITELQPLLDVVVLSNMTPSQAAPRLRNFDTLGLALPLVINTGPKGPAVKALAARAGRPVFFVDDIPHHLASVAAEAPDVFRIHLIGDKRLRALLPLSPHGHLRAETWSDAVSFILARLPQ
jgi:hypothetical protein